jgi:hypothetical protein
MTTCDWSRGKDVIAILYALALGLIEGKSRIGYVWNLH